MNAQVHDIIMTVNGEETRATVDARKTLVDFLRDDAALTGTHLGCEHGVCGACSVRVDGAVVRGCLMLAVQCDGARVETIEGVAETDEITDLQEAFIARNALQCGYCTPGMLLTACISPATTAAVPAIRRSWMRWKPSRRRGTLRGERDENHRRLASYALGPRPAELLYRQIGAAAQSRAAHPWSRPVRE